MKKILSITLLFILSITLLLLVIGLSGCTSQTPYVEKGLTDKEVRDLINVAILEDRLDTMGKYEALEKEIASLEREVQILELKNPIYNYDYTDYYLTEWTDEQLYAAVKQIFDNDNFTDEQWEELILEIIEDYNLIDEIEAQLLEFIKEVFMIALEEQTAGEE